MPRLEMAEGREIGVRLEPFIHQVGGHASMLRLNDSIVCKPLIARERNFYESMPPIMAEFTAQYRGIVTVKFVKESNGRVTPVLNSGDFARLSHLHITTSSDSALVSQMASISGRFSVFSCDSQPKESESLERDSLVEEDVDECGDAMAKNVDSVSYSGWNQHLVERYELLQRAETCKFILLENLASRYRLPCILDLKMGTRQHGDDATEAKRLGHMKKCANSTSCSLGLRICGMQVYQCDTGRYVCQSKYHGRSLDAAGVRQALTQFLHNGRNLRRELIPLIIDRLYKLNKILLKQNTFRFYSSSLLIMYDGCITDSINGCRETDVPSLTELNELDRSQFNSKLVASVKYIVPETEDTLSVLTRDHTAMEENDEEEEDTDSSLENKFYDIGKDNCSAGEGICGAEASKKFSHGKASAVVDVRMIDFAHATHQGFLCDQTVHRGPDSGYLFGLQNLIHMFEDM